ncbi:hypothetical protein Leryth_006598 [Lithospermum erythrorhizon]|nr:hypothetical protein Leryth_006598 [Lithospermum erythrorhizon]
MGMIMIIMGCQLHMWRIWSRLQLQMGGKFSPCFQMGRIESISVQINNTNQQRWYHPSSRGAKNNLSSRLSRQL